MSRAALAGAAALWTAASAAAVSSSDTQAAFRQAYQQARGAEVNVHLILTTAQARLKRLEFAFNELKERSSREQAREQFASYTRELAAFRQAAEAVTLSPAAPAPDARQQAPRRAPEIKEASTAELLNEIFRLRNGYDPAARRASAAGIQKRVDQLEGALGPAAPSPEQEVALKAGQALARRIRDAAAALRPRGELQRSRAAREASRHLQGLQEDAQAADIELELLRALYRLQGRLKAHPELEGS